MTLVKWGTDAQRDQWLEPMAKGEVIGSFAMTEPNVGSDIQAIEHRSLVNRLYWMQRKYPLH